MSFLTVVFCAHFQALFIGPAGCAKGGSMVKYVHSVGLRCLEGYIVRVEADVSDGMPGMDLVGYLGSEVKEARERVRMAIKNSGFSFPLRRITLNLSPADVRKSGTGFDLPMAVTILCSLGVLDGADTEDAVFLGELNLSGELGPIRGVLPLVLQAVKAGFRKCYVPKENAAEAALVEQMEVYPVSTLRELTEHLKGEMMIQRMIRRNDSFPEKEAHYEFDLKYVQGQPFARRGLEIAAAGLHNIIMVGEPGAGKSMLSKCLPSILPPLTMEESLEVSSVYSVAGRFPKDGTLMKERPFVAPHHTVTDVALTGGGIMPKAGLVALAHKGVLFLDEMPEFSRSALEILRQPLEDRKIMISRNGGNFTFPADFMLVGAMNPCPCGAYPDRSRCSCTTAQRKRYLERLSRPLMDRIDLCIEVKNLRYEELTAGSLMEDSATVCSRVEEAQKIQFARFSKARFNSQMGREEIEKYCALDGEGSKLMEKAFDNYRLSARSYHRVLKVARTIADLDHREMIESIHLIEALRFRNAGFLEDEERMASDYLQNRKDET